METKWTLQKKKRKIEAKIEAHNFRKQLQKYCKEQLTHVDQIAFLKTLIDLAIQDLTKLNDKSKQIANTIKAAYAILEKVKKN